MTLADTSVWIEHFRHGQVGLAPLLSKAQILMHPFVWGELACGSLKNRAAVLSHLEYLPAVTIATHSEVLMLIETHKLWSLGLGWIDCHLLASSFLADCRFWTLDKRLAQAAARIGVSVSTASFTRH
jgi:predicted nucleic acid-binding protein